MVSSRRIDAMVVASNYGVIVCLLNMQFLSGEIRGVIGKKWIAINAFCKLYG